MNTINSLEQQLGASLGMLKKAIITSDEKIWISNDPPFWQIAFHISNSINFYFSTFNPLISNPNEDYELPVGMQKHAFKDFFDNKPEEIVEQKEVIHFLASTRDRIRNYFNNEIETQFSDPSGFPWLPFTKYELIIYNIRHIMEHTAILNQILKAHGKPAAGWIGIEEL